MTLPAHSPWGQIDGREKYADGVVLVSTPSHGGFWLSPDRLAKVPFAWRMARFHPSEDGPWFEEDCDWCMVALTFPDLFQPEQIEIAQRTFDHWIAPKIAA